LGARSTGNPNIPRRHNDEFTGGKLVTMLLQRFIQMFALGLQLGPGKPEEQDAGVSKPLMENQLAESRSATTKIRCSWRAIARTSSSARPGG
jgi:hypothetical protein